MAEINEMKIQALDIRIGHRIIAYCNNKMQTCTVKQILDPDQNNITLTVFTSGYRRNVSYVVRFHRDTFVNLAA